MTSPSLSDTAQRLLDDIPAFMAESDVVQRVTDAVARELERVQFIADSLRNGIQPQNATDQYGFLPLWERLFGLPVQPEGVTLRQRQSNVLAHMRKRRAGRAIDWIEAMNGLLGTGAWMHTENADLYEITVTMPYTGGSYRAYQAERLAREITPAHLDIRVVYDTGFQLGVSLLGIDRL